MPEWLTAAAAALAPTGAPLALEQTDIGLLLAVSFTAALARGFSGFGGALIFIPLASAVVEPRLAVITLFLIDAVLSLGFIPRAVRLADKREVATMAAGAVLGAPLGTAILAYAAPLVVRWFIVAVVAGMLALLMSGWRYRGTPLKPLTVATGFIAGIFGGAAQVSGPPVVAYWLGGSRSVVQIRANIVAYFAISTLITGFNYALAGFFDGRGLVLALMVGPAYGLGLYCGSKLFGRANEAIFRRACFGLIGAAVLLGLPLFDGILR